MAVGAPAKTQSQAAASLNLYLHQCHKYHHNNEYNSDEDNFKRSSTSDDSGSTRGGSLASVASLGRSVGGASLLSLTDPMEIFVDDFEFIDGLLDLLQNQANIQVHVRSVCVCVCVCIGLLCSVCVWLYVSPFEHHNTHTLYSCT